MALKRKFSLAVIDSEKIDEINEIVKKYAISFKQYSSYHYFKVNPANLDDYLLDITFFQLESENRSGLDKRLKEMIETINQLNTIYAIRDEESREMIVAIDYISELHIKFDHLKIIKKNTYKKIDELKHVKTEFGICKSYNPNFRPLENKPLENVEIKHEIIYLFSKSEENFSKLKTMISEKIMEIDSDFEIEFKPFVFKDDGAEYI